MVSPRAPRWRPCFRQAAAVAAAAAVVVVVENFWQEQQHHVPRAEPRRRQLESGIRCLQSALRSRQAPIRCCGYVPPSPQQQPTHTPVVGTLVGVLPNIVWYTSSAQLDLSASCISPQNVHSHRHLYRHLYCLPNCHPSQLLHDLPNLPQNKGNHLETACAVLYMLHIYCIALYSKMVYCTNK